MTSVLDLSPTRLARCIRVLDRGLTASPIVHLIALSFLLPESAGGSSRICSLLATCARSRRKRCERLFVRLPATIGADDLESVEERGALVELADALARTGDADETRLAPQSGVRIAGEIARDRVGALLPELETAPLGSVIPWILCAELLGTEIVYRASQSASLQAYRASLLERFASLSEQSPQIFWKALARGEEPLLRERLGNVIDGLRGAAALAATA
ncbi:MAG: hypothetical protein ACYC8W_09215 [Candidatus Tyrphobacter sp.]